MQRSIFVLPHQDDECGCYEPIRQAVQSGHQVECYFLTDGGYGGQCIEAREKESLHALQKLGVHSENIHFIGHAHSLPDGFLLNHLERTCDILSQYLEDGLEISAIYAPAWEGGHVDHDATHIVACAASETLVNQPDLWQFPLYNGQGLTSILFHVLKPLPSNGPPRKLKVPTKHKLEYLRLFLSYPTQWKIWVAIFPFMAYKVLFSKCYYIQRATLPVRVTKPHHGKLLYERKGQAHFEDFAAKADAFITHQVSQIRHSQST